MLYGLGHHSGSISLAVCNLWIYVLLHHTDSISVVLKYECSCPPYWNTQPLDDLAHRSGDMLLAVGNIWPYVQLHHTDSIPNSSPDPVLARPNSPRRRYLGVPAPSVVV